jgi:hypothetical protein
VRRAGLLSGLLLVAGVAAGVLMIVTEFTHIRYVTSITASCSDFAGKSVRDGCLTIGHQSHSWSVGLLGLFAILMAFGAAVGRSRPAAVALTIAGAVVLGITLLHDLPNTRKTGQIGFAFVQARAHKGAGFWLELIGGVLALVAGLTALLRLRREQRRPDPEDELGEEPAPA